MQAMMMQEQIHSSDFTDQIQMFSDRVVIQRVRCMIVDAAQAVAACCGVRGLS